MNIDNFTKSQCVQLLGDHNILVSKAEAKRTPVAELRTRAKAAAAKTETKVLKQPGALSDVKAVRGSTKRAAMIQALVKGATLDQLAKLTGWSRDVCSGALYTDVVSASYGLEREGSTYRLILPKGLRAPAITKSGESRGEALKAACK